TDMPEYTRFQIAFAAEWIDERAVFVTRHRIDGQVAAREILFERDLWRRVKHEAVVAGSGLALGARQRVLLVRLRMQEHREVFPDRAESGGNHLLRRRPDHDPVAIAVSATEQVVAHASTDDEDLHVACTPHTARPPIVLQRRARARIGLKRVRGLMPAR